MSSIVAIVPQIVPYAGKLPYETGSSFAES